MEEYLLKVSEAIEPALARRLALEKSPKVARLATLAPLSNYGYTEGVVGALLKVDAEGVVVGDENKTEVPRLFVPWQNISYLADGTSLFEEQTRNAEQLAQQATQAAPKPPPAVPNKGKKG